MWWLALLSAPAQKAEVPTVAFTVPAEHRVVEGIATDGKTVWVSSPLDRTIIEHRNGRMRVIPLPASVPSPYGIAWDSERRWLWIAATCLTLPKVELCDDGALVAIDRSGKLRARYTPGGRFTPGDVSVARGQVFVSDGRSGAIYRLAPGAKALTAIVAAGVGKSGQGSALDARGRALIIADYGAGITRVDLQSGRRDLLPMIDGRPLKGVDGLIRRGDWYYGVRNGASPYSIVRFRIVGNQIDADDVASGGSLIDPTQIAAADDRLLVVANAGWDTAAKSDAPRRDRATVVSIALLP